MMEQHHQQQQQQNVGGEEMSMSMNGGKMSNTNNNNHNTNNNNNNYNMCRQSSTRWTPTTEQIKLLKELYYIKGVRSPSADEIQHICTRLRRYGKIEGKNVFYWFQNHKARERQKKRFNHTTSSSSILLPNNNNNNNNSIITPNNINNNNNPIIANNTTTTTTTSNNNNNGFIINNNNGGLGWKQDHHQDITLHAKYPSCTLNNPGVSCSSSSGGLISGGGQLMGSFGYGAVTMENKFRDCSISSGGGGYMLNGGNQWSGVGTNYNPYAPSPYSNFLDKISSIDEDSYYGASQAPHIETLPLFPMHNDDHHHHQHHDHDDDDDGYGHDHHHHHDYNHHGFWPVKTPPDGYYTGGYRWPNGMGGSASLELSLNSYGYGCYSQNL